MQRLSLVLVLAATLALAACNKEEAAPAADTAPVATPAAPPPADPIPATPPPADPDPTTVSTDMPAAAPLGVAECDDYLTKYEACLAAHVPAESREALRQSLDATRAGWAQAITAGGAASLAAACTQMRESARASLQAYGCTDF